MAVLRELISKSLLVLPHVLGETFIFLGISRVFGEKHKTNYTR
jgi:hypothetical protein